MNKKSGKWTWVALLALGFGYWIWVSKGNGGMDGIRALPETTVPDSDQPNMKTKVPAGANTDHMWLVKG